MDVARHRTLAIGRLRLGKSVLLAVGAVCAALALAAGFVALRRSASGAAPVVARSSIWTDRVRRGDLLRQVPVQGTLVPEHVEWLSAASPGRVVARAVKPGAEVEADTVVVVLENADLELAALEAERNAATAEAALVQLDVRTDADAKLASVSLATLRADLDDARRHADAADRLAPEGLVSANDRDDARSKASSLADRLRTEDARVRVLDGGRGRQLAAQRAELQRLRDIAAFTRRRLAALEIRAGVRGVVQDIPLEVGQWVTVGTVLAKIAPPDRLKGEVHVAEAEARDVHRGLPVRFDAGTGAFRGHVERVDPVVAHGTVRIEVAIDDALPPGARADQTVTGWVEIETLRGVLFVARPAGATPGAPAAVFRLEADGAHASRVTARLGRGSAREVEVAAGLVEGDEIVISDVPTPEGATRIRLQ